MKRTSLFFALGILLALGAIDISSLSAADRREHLGGFRQWEAFQITRQNGNKVCYMVSVPINTSPQNVRRGDIYVTITHTPETGNQNVVNIVVGYPFRAESEATATIDGRRFKMFTDGENAWTYTSKDDNDMVAAMRAGNRLVVEGTSSRGTDTRDVYSLSGFTAANQAITRACQ